LSRLANLAPSRLINLQNVETSLQERLTVEEQQRLLLDKLSRQLAERQDGVTMATEEKSDELERLTSQSESLGNEVRSNAVGKKHFDGSCLFTVSLDLNGLLRVFMNEVHLT